MPHHSLVPHMLPHYPFLAPLRLPQIPPPFSLALIVCAAHAASRFPSFTLVTAILRAPLAFECARYPLLLFAQPSFCFLVRRKDPSGLLSIVVYLAYGTTSNSCLLPNPHYLILLSLLLLERARDWGFSGLRFRFQTCFARLVLLTLAQLSLARVTFFIIG